MERGGREGLYGRPGVGLGKPYIDGPTSPGDPPRATIKAHTTSAKPPSPLRNPLFPYSKLQKRGIKNQTQPTPIMGPIPKNTTQPGTNNLLAKRTARSLNIRAAHTPLRLRPQLRRQLPQRKRHILDLTHLQRFISFDQQTGLLRCEAGVSLAEILDIMVPRGWFLPVTPGTKFVSVGGAIANDIHGKNHHRSGTFGCHITASNSCAQTASASPAHQTKTANYSAPPSAA